MVLEREIATYDSRRKELLENAGKFVLIHHEDIVDFFSTYEDAIKAGYQRFGLDPFLVKQINQTEPVHYVTRVVEPQLAKRTA